MLASPPVKEADFRPLERELAELLSAGSDTADGALDSIANLALLPGGDNSALSNSVFAVKRAVILEHDRRGSYIPVCTRNVFLKYYSPADEHQMHFWSARDREHYLDAMADACATTCARTRRPQREGLPDVVRRPVRGPARWRAGGRQHRDPAYPA